jgi:hypothetical protein
VTLSRYAVSYELLPLSTAENSTIPDTNHAALKMLPECDCLVLIKLLHRCLVGILQPSAAAKPIVFSRPGSPESELGGTSNNSTCDVYVSFFRIL